MNLKYGRKSHSFLLWIVWIAVLTLSTTRRTTVWANDENNYYDNNANDVDEAQDDGGEEVYYGYAGEDGAQDEAVEGDQYYNGGEDEDDKVDEYYDQTDEDAQNNENEEGGEQYGYGEDEGDGYYDAEDGDDDNAENEGANQNYYQFNGEMDMDDLVIMPLSCIRYNQEHMIKFQIYEKAQNDDDGNDVCQIEDEDNDEGVIGTFVAPVADYMRAYFNYEVLLKGSKYRMPHNAGHLQCTMLQHSYTSKPIYAKIGCMEREAFTSTKLRLHLYSDEDCTALYDDNRSDSIRGIKGYNINGTYFNPFVSFSPPFYTCSTCKPQFISQYFTKDYTYWIDDDEAQNGKVSYQYFDDWVDDFQTLDDDAWRAVSFAKKYHKNDDDYYSRRLLLSDESALNRNLGQEDDAWNNEWNMCSQLMKYGSICDEDCLAIGPYTLTEWSIQDYILLSIITIVMVVLMTIIYKKKSYAYRMELEESKDNCCGQCSATLWYGLPVLFATVLFFGIIGVLASSTYMHLVNETLLVGIIICIALFVYTVRLPSYKAKKAPLLSQEATVA